MLPNTAMPSAPPSSRVVSLTAEPTPALAIGTAFMIPLVAGAATIAMPDDSRTIADDEDEVRRVDVDERHQRPCRARR